jgi:hypothetical protein
MTTFNPNAHIHFTGRACVRCGKALTDAASMEVGVGPICRKLDNHLLAQMFPANVAEAQVAVKTFDLNDISPETHGTYAKVAEALAANETSDWRETVKRIEWILSYGTSPSNNAALTTVVAALGYVGLAALWNGDAATGLATVWFAAGRLYLAGPRNAAARAALKSIPGIKGGAAKDAQGADVKFAWSVPAAAHGAFFRAVVTHYPHNQGLVTAIGEAQAYKAPEAEVAAPVVEAPKATVLVGNEVVKLKTPYSPAFVAAIKGLPYKERAWNPVEKVWEVKMSCRTAAEGIVAQHFGKYATVQATVA